MISESISKAISNGLLRAIPEAALTVSQWAATRRVVSAERVADPSLAGFWKNERTPYLVEIMDAVNDPGINEIVFVKSSQVGGTECINNIIGYFMDADPATILYVCENEGKARAWSVESFAPMLRDTPALAALMGEAKMRDSNNQIESKSFPDGHFALAWASSPATLSSRPRRVILTDETDAFEPTKEGDPIDLAEARTKTAGHMRKIIHVSTPRDKETSKIEPMYENSTREKYFLPCPFCEELQFLKWENVIWDEGEPETALYFCEHCGEGIEEDQKAEMLAAGKWLSTNPEYQGNRRGFWINEIYSPFSTWAQMAAAFLEAKPYPDKLKVFVNTRLAQTWETDGEKIDYADLSFLQEDFEAEVPDGVLLLTAGVDVQDDRIECEVVGWGTDFESWSLAYKVFWGNPAEKEIWDELREYLCREWTNAEDEIFRVRAAAIDTGGHHTQDAYKFCKANVGRRFFAIKGANTSGKPISSKPTKNNSLRVNLYTIGTEAAKDKFFGFLKKQVEEGEQGGGPGYCHFPSDREANYFKMLCAEKKVTKFVQGRATHHWVKVSASARNEALDCRVYAIAALNILNPDWKTYAARRREKRETEEIAENKPVENVSDNKARKPIVRRSGFVNGGSRGGGFVGGWK